MSLSRQADTLRLIAERLSLPTLQQFAAQPGVNEAVRLSIAYHDARHPNSTATLCRGIGKTCQLSVAYERHDQQGKPLIYDFQIPLVRYQTLLTALRGSQFDTLDDSPDMPPYGVDLWLVERASGRFFHDVLLAPPAARGHHRELVMALRGHLAEAMRELTV
jgi:hypothetical protein